MSVDQDLCKNYIQKKEYKEKDLGRVQKWFGKSKDEKRRITVVEPIIEGDGSLKLRCKVEKRLETKTPVHILENIVEDISVSSGNRMVSLHNGECYVRCKVRGKV